MRADATPMYKGGVESWTAVITKMRGAVKPIPAIALKASPIFAFVPDKAKPMILIVKRMKPVQMGHLRSRVLVTSIRQQLAK